MRLKKSKPEISRRKFLTIAGLATTAAGLKPGKLLAAEQSTTTAAAPKPTSEPAAIRLPENKIAQVLEIKTICVEPGKFPVYNTDQLGRTVLVAEKEPNRYIGWPTILKTREGKLMVVFSGDRDAHVCPYGKTQVITSDDNGKTWSEPSIINNTAIDDRDAGIIQTKKGTLVVSWFTSLEFENPTRKGTYAKYARIGEKIPAETKKELLGNWVRRSEDGGKTWLKPSRTAGTAPHGPIALKNGDLLYISTGAWEGKFAMLCEKSTDDGRTWNTISHIPFHPDYQKNMSEPHVVELKSGKLIAMIRNEPAGNHDDSYLLQSESTDGGKTWTQMHKTEIWGYPPHLIQLRNGWILAVYGVRREPFGQRACISKDEGKTWDYKNEINLGDAVNTDHGYPSSQQLDDGSIMTVYYQSPKQGEPTVVMATHWKLI